MELVILLLLVGMGYAIRSGRDHSRDTRRRSGTARVRAAGKAAAPRPLPLSRQRMIRVRHGAGWWGGEILRGLPVTRTGVHAGWLGHQAASDHARAAREEARTTHLETRASVLASLPEHRRRQREARDLIIAAAADPETGRAKGREAVREAADDLARKRAERQRGAVRPPVPLPSETVKPEAGRGPYAAKDDAGRPGDSDWLRPGESPCTVCGGTGESADGICPDCGGWGSAPPDPLAPEAAPGAICGACGHPGTEDDPVLADGPASIHRSHALADPRNQVPADPDSGYYALPEDDPGGRRCEECWLPLAGEPGDGTVHERCTRLLSADDAATEVHDNRDLEVVESDLRSRHACPHQIRPAGFDGGAIYCGRPVCDSRDPGSPCTFCPEHQCEAAGDDDSAADEHHDYVRRLRDREATTPSTGGSPMSDTSYTEVLNRSRAFVAQADQDGAAIDARLSQAIADADAMQGAEVDGATLGDQMDLIDRLQAAKAALAAVGEQAGAVAQGVQQRHGNLAEAHRDAPVAAAHRDFYSE